MTLTPGAYLKHRRQAALLSASDVAARIQTEPRTAEHARAEWIELIEADAIPATFATIVALRSVYHFDLEVLAALEAIAQGHAAQPPQLCRFCACSEEDACNPPCWWAAEDLCSGCVSAAAAAPVLQQEERR